LRAELNSQWPITESTGMQITTVIRKTYGKDKEKTRKN
jgi:hypothetical protein